MCTMHSFWYLLIVCFFLLFTRALTTLMMFFKELLDDKRYIRWIANIYIVIVCRREVLKEFGISKMTKGFKEIEFWRWWLNFLFSFWILCNYAFSSTLCETCEVFTVNPGGDFGNPKKNIVYFIILLPKFSKNISIWSFEAIYINIINNYNLLDDMCLIFFMYSFKVH